MTILCRHEARYVQGRNQKTLGHGMYVDFRKIIIRSDNDQWLVDPDRDYEDVFGDRQYEWHFEVDEHKPSPMTGIGQKK